MEECGERRPCSKKRCSCLCTIIGIILALLLATVGLILGAVFSVALLANIAILITVAVLLAVAAVLVLIYKLCKCKKGC